MLDFLSRLSRPGLIIFDGAMGTLLQAKGLAPGESPEAFGLVRPDAIREVHREYIQAGSTVITTNTFGGTKPKLPENIDVFELNREMARLAKAEAAEAGHGVYVAGSVGPTGHFVAPLGELSLQELVGIFEAQIEGLAAGGIDLVVGETHFDLAEAKAVVMAARRVEKKVGRRLPVAMLMTFEAGKTLTGTTPAVFAATMRNLGVDLIGANCGAGPDEIARVVDGGIGCAGIPFFIKPNAGLPMLVDGKTVFPMGPDEFAKKTILFAARGAKALSGCCGTSPAHIRALAELAGQAGEPAALAAPAWTGLTSRSTLVRLGEGLSSVIIGERINPTGKKLLTEELQAGLFSEALRFAAEQEADGARILDVNVGAPLVDETDVLPALTLRLIERHTSPLCLDSNNVDALAAGLWAYPGAALVNSISGEPGRMEALAPLCVEHGAPFILLPIEGRKLPAEAAERIRVIDSLVEKAEGFGVPRHLIVVDALALTVSSKPLAARACLETIAHCRSLGLPTTLGLSNISFGLPARELVNSTFLTMCMAAGLTSLIANPMSTRLREALSAGEVLLGRDPQAESFIAGYSAWTSGEGGGGARVEARGKGGAAANLREAVVNGEKDRIVGMVDEELAKGRQAKELLDADLIPGIMDVGVKYERKEYFLPQLLLSAETMQKAFDHVKPLLEQAGEGANRPVIVVATVEGDIHDIGKNIAALMLRNHGFEVVDLGKDVPAKVIVDKAQELGAPLIGLSALMTTTMVKMEETITMVAERGLPAKVIIGGAVVTEAFAKAIRADGFATDAVESVRVAKSLLENQAR